MPTVKELLSENARLEAENTRLEAENTRLEAKVSVLKELLEQAVFLRHSQSTASNEISLIKKLSIKQQAALQMVLRGASNREIADRFGVTESTAKVYVKCIMDHLGVRRRDAIVAKLHSAFINCSDDEYLRLTGLPKDWDVNWQNYPEINEKLFEKTR